MTKHAMDLTGTVFGRLTVLDRADNMYNHTAWRCKCSCGNEKVVSRGSLISGNTKSCGCLRKNPRKWVAKYSHGDITQPWVGDSYRKPKTKRERGFRNYLVIAKRAAYLRDREWSLTDDESFSITQRPCYYCGVEPKQELGPRYAGEFVYNGIDRVDNNKGYISGNCVPCCGDCNKAKGTKTVEQFHEWLCRAYSYFLQEFGDS